VPCVLPEELYRPVKYPVIVLPAAFWESTVSGEVPEVVEELVEVAVDEDEAEELVDEEEVVLEVDEVVVEEVLELEVDDDVVVNPLNW
jgi:hypothetical protein